jgi:hypothetical protein
MNCKTVTVVVEAGIRASGAPRKEQLEKTGEGFAKEGKLEFGFLSFSFFLSF